MKPPNRPRILSNEDMERKFSEVEAEIRKGCKINSTRRSYAPNPTSTILIHKNEWDVVFTRVNVPLVHLLMWITPDGEEKRRIWWFKAPDGTEYFHAKNPPEVFTEGDSVEPTVAGQYDGIDEDTSCD